MKKIGSYLFPCLLTVSSLYCLSADSSSAYGKEGESVNAKKIFEYKCKTCHGSDGKGTKRGQALKSQDLSDPEWQASRTDKEILETITNGKNKMPAWKERLTPEEIEALAKYVRKLKAK
ncbi:MAG: c-type cytochrome [Candidatus Brocadiaceae bacterium]|nr:c-type cytochrome [Candidatus Brocadiaceae bacterium]